MRAKEYLQQVYKLEESIKSKQNKIEALHDIALSCSSNITGMPKSPNSGGSPMANAITKAVSIESELKQDHEELIRLKLEVTENICQMSEYRFVLILIKRYLKFWNWSDIADELDCTDSWVLKMHRKALVAFDEVLKNKGEKNELL